MRKELLRKEEGASRKEEGALEEGGRSFEECLNLRKRKEEGRSFVWPAVESEVEAAAGGRSRRKEEGAGGRRNTVVRTIGQYISGNCLATRFGSSLEKVWK